MSSLDYSFQENCAKRKYYIPNGHYIGTVSWRVLGGTSFLFAEAAIHDSRDPKINLQLILLFLVDCSRDP